MKVTQEFSQQKEKWENEKERIVLEHTRVLKNKETELKKLVVKVEEIANKATRIFK